MVKSPDGTEWLIGLRAETGHNKNFTVELPHYLPYEKKIISYCVEH